MKSTFVSLIPGRPVTRTSKSHEALSVNDVTRHVFPSYSTMVINPCNLSQATSSNHEQKKRLGAQQAIPNHFSPASGTWHRRPYRKTRRARGWRCCLRNPVVQRVPPRPLKPFRCLHIQPQLRSARCGFTLTRGPSARGPPAHDWRSHVVVLGAASGGEVSALDMKVGREGGPWGGRPAGSTLFTMH